MTLNERLEAADAGSRELDEMLAEYRAAKAALVRWLTTPMRALRAHLQGDEHATE